jgi:hypothetical protein
MARRLAHSVAVAASGSPGLRSRPLEAPWTALLAARREPTRERPKPSRSSVVSRRCSVVSRDWNVIGGSEDMEPLEDPVPPGRTQQNGLRSPDSGRGDRRRARGCWRTRGVRVRRAPLSGHGPHGSRLLDSIPDRGDRERVGVQRPAHRAVVLRRRDYERWQPARVSSARSALADSVRQRIGHCSGLNVAPSCLGEVLSRPTVFLPSCRD